MSAPSPGPKYSNANDRTPAILVVENEILIRLAISDYLRECGFKVYEAGSSGEAIEIFQSNRAAIDLVFTDVRLPDGMDGFGLAQWVRQNRPGVRVILTSGDNKKSEAAKGLCEKRALFREALRRETRCRADS